MSGGKKRLVTTSLAGAGVVLLSAVSVWVLRAPYHNYIWNVTFQGFAAVLPTTAWAATRVWIFWGLATAIIGELLLRADPEIGLFDAVFAGAVGTWVFAYVAGNLLGPIGLFRASTLWLIMLGGIIALARRPFHLTLRTPSNGLKLALLACALVAIGVLPMQLGSPVPPYMDVLNNPASAQRVVTFHLYLPWDNDPYGHWSPGIQTPGLELFYSLLALGSATPLAVLAETAATLPMMCLIIFATWRLGRTLIGDGSGGGMAAVLLFATTIFMRGIQMRGTAVAFVLVAGGLAFLLDRERRPLRTALAAIMLGSAFASHAIDAAFGLSTAGLALALELPDRDFRNLVREVACIIGALLIAVPEFAVALVIRLPYPILPACQVAGIAVIYLAARGITPRPHIFRATHWLRRGLLVITLALFAFFPSDIARTVYATFPMLTVLCIGGLLLAAVDYRHSDGIWVAGVALVIAGAAQYAILAALRVLPDAQMQFGLSDIIYKLQEYWSPYFLVFPAAVLFDWVYRHLSRPLAVALVLVLVVFPWTERPELDINYNEHALVDQWAVNWWSAQQGYWSNSPNSRWLQSPEEFALIDKLRAEIRAGHITPATHVIHVAPESIIWKDELLYSLYTGVDDDLYVMKPDGDTAAGPMAHSRMHPATMLPDALASKPPYIVVYHQPPTWMKLPPPGYDEIFSEGDIRLFRRDDLAR